MTGLSAYGEVQVLAPLIASAFVSLHTADPGPLGTTGEVVAGGYARQPVTFTETGGNPTVAANSALITFPLASANWGLVGYFGVWDAASGGNFRGSGSIPTPVTVNAGDTARFTVGSLTITAQ